MPAKKSRQSRNAQKAKDGKLRYGLSRNARTRPTIPRVTIVSDDSDAAPAYFLILKRLFKDKITIIVNHSRCEKMSPDEVAARAERELDALESDDDANEQTRDAVWVLLDVEGEPARQYKIKNMRSQLSKKGMRVALSKPCFELWTLLHLEDTGQYFADCSKVIERLKQKWKARFGEDFFKARADYSKIIGDRLLAAERAKQHDSAENENLSWTQVYRVVEYVESLV